MAKVLIVDDSTLMRRLLRRMLEPRGYQIVEATDAASAIQGYTAEEPDIVLLDLNLGSTSGFDVLAELQTCDPGVRVIMVTADTEESTRIAVERAGGHGLLTKPCDPQTLIDTIETALAVPLCGQGGRFAGNVPLPVDGPERRLG
jgi:two-component system chemotaxis response regulator CheY